MEHLPSHVALIMDGNRRWAKEKRLPKFKGHLTGESKIEPIIDRSIELGIQNLTFWALAIKNWNRKPEEIKFLLNLFRTSLNRKVNKYHRKNIRIKVLGNLSLFPKDIQDMTNGWVEQSKNNTKITVNFAMSYGGRDEILRAINKLPKDHKEITEEEFGQYLDTAGQPDPDLLIRTGGQQRLSDFLPWQIADTELYFTPTFWPDFTVEEFNKSLDWYSQQKRNFGK